MKAHVGTRHGLLRRWRWETFDSEEGPTGWWEAVARDNPRLARQLRARADRAFMEDWMIYCGARRGRQVRFEWTR